MDLRRKHESGSQVNKSETATGAMKPQVVFRSGHNSEREAANRNWPEEENPQSPAAA